MTGKTASFHCQYQELSGYLGPEPSLQASDVTISNGGGNTPADDRAELVAMAGAGRDDQALAFLMRQEFLVGGESVGAGDDLGNLVFG